MKNKISFLCVPLNKAKNKILMEENSLAEPEIKVDQGDIFVLTLKNSNYNDKVSSKVGSKTNTKLSINQEKILKLIQENPYISRNDLSKKVGISETSIYNNLQKLKKQGVIERIGADKNGHWKIINN